MPPKLQSEDGRHVVIRPLAYVAERDIERYAAAREFPIIPCKLCGSQDNMQRKVVKKMLLDWEQQFPGRTETIFSALRNVVPSHLADAKAFDFASLSLSPTPSPPEGESGVRGSSLFSEVASHDPSPQPSLARGEGVEKGSERILSGEEWFEQEIEPA
jgi:tRNA 2-thiocytidine biosynthesis protein TtcA